MSATDVGVDTEQLCAGRTAADPRPPSRGPSVASSFNDQGRHTHVTESTSDQSEARTSDKQSAEARNETEVHSLRSEKCNAREVKPACSGNGCKASQEQRKPASEGQLKRSSESLRAPKRHLEPTNKNKDQESGAAEQGGVSYETERPKQRRAFGKQSKFTAVCENESGWRRGTREKQDYVRKKHALVAGKQKDVRQRGGKQPMAGATTSEQSPGGMSAAKDGKMSQTHTEPCKGGVQGSRRHDGAGATRDTAFRDERSQLRNQKMSKQSYPPKQDFHGRKISQQADSQPQRASRKRQGGRPSEARYSNNPNDRGAAMNHAHLDTSVSTATTTGRKGKTRASADQDLGSVNTGEVKQQDSAEGGNCPTDEKTKRVKENLPRPAKPPVKQNRKSGGTDKRKSRKKEDDETTERPSCGPVRKVPSTPGRGGQRRSWKGQRSQDEDKSGLKQTKPEKHHTCNTGRDQLKIPKKVVAKETRLYVKVHDVVNDARQLQDVLTAKAQVEIRVSEVTVTDSSTFCTLVCPSKNQARKIHLLLTKDSHKFNPGIECRFVLIQPHLKEMQQKENQRRRTALEKIVRTEFDERSEGVLRVHHLKSEALNHRLDEAKDKRKRGCNLYTFAVNEQEIATLEEKQKELENQKQEFKTAADRLREELFLLLLKDNFVQEVRDLRRRFGVEAFRLEKALPVYAERANILQMVKENQVSIVLGETGSGKSTQLVQYLMEAGFADHGAIVCAQPRKVAAVSLARHVSKELAVGLGREVGYKVGSRSRRSTTTKILFTTDHSLLNECLADPSLRAFSCIVVDEAHERSLYTDLLLAMIKRSLRERKDLKVIVTSATIDPKVFQDFFTTNCESCPVMQVSGRTFPVEVFHQETENEENLTDKYVDQAVQKAIEIHANEPPGDILVFLTSPLETEKCCKSFQDKMEGAKGPYQCFQLHGQQQAEEQQKVFEPLGKEKRKIVFATNCAETSITIDGIRYVVDTGVAKEMRYDHKRNLNSLSVTIISQSSAEQRKGRAGRTAPGKCYRLYSKATFDAMDKVTLPEILRTHLGHALLKLAELGVEHGVYDFVQSPSHEAIIEALSSLDRLGALVDGKITEEGKWIAGLPLDPPLGKLVLLGKHENVLYDAVVLAAVMSTGTGVFYRGITDTEKAKLNKTKVEKFCHGGGDCLTALEVYKEWQDVPEKDKNKWCVENSLNAKALRGARETANDVCAILQRGGNAKVLQKFSLDKSAHETLRKLIFRCYAASLCHYLGVQSAGYFAAQASRRVHIHPSSVLRDLAHTPPWLVYSQLVRTSRDFIMGITPVEESWVAECSKKELGIDFEAIRNKTVSKVHTIKAGRHVFFSIVGPQYTRLRQLEENLSSEVDHAAQESNDEPESFRAVNEEENHVSEETSIADGTGALASTLEMRREDEDMSMTHDDALRESSEETEISSTASDDAGVDEDGEAETVTVSNDDVVLEANRELGTVSVWTTGSPYDTEHLISKLESIVKTAVDELKKENQEIPVAGHKRYGVRVLLGQGAMVQEILTPRRTRKVFISYPRDEARPAEELILSKFSEFGDIEFIMQFDKGKHWGFLVYRTSEQARKAERMTRTGHEFTAEVEHVHRHQPQEEPEFEHFVRLTWCTIAPCLGFAVVQIAPQLYHRCLQMRWFYIDGREAVIMRHGQTDSCLVVWNIISNMTEDDVKWSLLHALGFERNVMNDRGNDVAVNAMGENAEGNAEVDDVAADAENDDVAAAAENDVAANTENDVADNVENDDVAAAAENDVAANTDWEGDVAAATDNDVAANAENDDIVPIAENGGVAGNAENDVAANAERNDDVAAVAENGGVAANAAEREDAMANDANGDVAANVEDNGVGANAEEDEQVVENVSIPRGPLPQDLSETDLEDELRDILRPRMHDFAYKLHRKTKPDVNGFASVDVSFTNPQQWERASKILGRKFYLIDNIVNVLPLVSGKTYIDRSAWKSCRDDVNEAINDWEGGGLVHVLIEELSNSRVDSSRGACITITAATRKEVMAVKAELNELVRGEVVDCNTLPNFEYLMSQSGRAFLEEAERRTGASVSVDGRLCTVVIHGKEQARVKMRKRMEEYTSLDRATLALKGDGVPPGFMRALVERYGVGLDDFCGETGLQSASLDFRSHHLKVVGQQDNVHAARQCIQQEMEKLREVCQPPLPEDREYIECAVCLSVVEGEHLSRLELCGHPYCRSCLKAQVSVAIKDRIFPVCCCHEGCDQPLAWRDFRNMMRKGDFTSSDLAAASVCAFVQANQNIVRFCPTTDCKAVYNARGGIVEGEDVFVCPVCHVGTCTFCHERAHKGQRCKMVTEHLDEEVKAWVDRDPLNRKPCPKCRTLIEKNLGCNHMRCENCKTHFCWLCGKVFLTVKKCYDHLIECHGGIHVR